jgi:hypothetical protein
MAMKEATANLFVLPAPHCRAPSAMKPILPGSSLSSVPPLEADIATPASVVRFVPNSEVAFLIRRPLFRPQVAGGRGFPALCLGSGLFHRSSRQAQIFFRCFRRRQSRRAAISHRRSLRRLQSGGVEPVVQMGCRIGSSSLSEQFLLLRTRREKRSAFTREFGKHCQTIAEGLNLFETPPLLLGALTNDTSKGRSSKSDRVAHGFR